MRPPRNNKWRRFREEVIALDGHKCVRCGRKSIDGVVLQVHHKEYLDGHFYWDYPYALCETLCKGCHAREHGHIMPSSGWKWGGWDDLGDLSGECEYCGTQIRYVFQIQHPKWRIIEVGEFCCDKLTASVDASEALSDFKRSCARRERFARSKKWALASNGSQNLNQKGHKICVSKHQDGHFEVSVDGIRGRKKFSDANVAKLFVYDNLEKITSYLSGR